MVAREQLNSTLMVRYEKQVSVAIHFALREVLERCQDEDQYQSRCGTGYGSLRDYLFEVRSQGGGGGRSSKFEVNKRLSREPGNLASKTKTRSKLRTQNSEPGTRNPEPGTRNPEPGNPTQFQFSKLSSE